MDIELAHDVYSLDIILQLMETTTINQLLEILMDCPAPAQNESLTDYTIDAISD